MFSILIFKLFLFFILSFVISFLLLPIIIESVKLRELYDPISNRNPADLKVPGFGGLPIFISSIISLSFFFQFSYSKFEAIFLIPSCLLLFFTGVKDDITGISPRNKLLLQIISTLFILQYPEFQITNFHGFLGIDEISLWISCPLSFLFIIFLINAYNLIDGIDGLAGGLAILIFAFFAFIYFIIKEYHMTAVCLSLMGSFVAFLFFNLSSKKRIFMGDTGSLFVGFLLAAFAINILSKNLIQNIDIAYISNFPLLIISVLYIPIFDTLRVIIIRLKNGAGISTSDRRHIHHFITDELRLKHYQATLVIISINSIIFILMVVLANILNNLMFIVCLIIPAAILSLTINILKRKNKN